MKRKLLLLFVPLLFLGCSKENEGFIDNPKQPEPEFTGKYVIPLEYALNDLQAFLDAENPQTRSTEYSKSTKKIKGVSTVVAGGAVTRSSGLEKAPIAYIVAFEGDGCAVLGADVRAAGVMAIMDEGELSPEHFAYKEFGSQTRSIEDEDFTEKVDEEGYLEYTPVTEDEFPYLLGSFINAYIQDEIIEAKESPITRATWEWNGKVWTYDEKIGPLMRSIWHQNSPFNDNCSAMMGKTVVAGCVSIALAQIMTYHQHPSTWKGNSLNWDLVRRVYCRYEGSGWTYGTPYEREWASYLVAVCGTQAKTKYGKDASGTTDRKARIAMENMGYTGVDVKRWSGLTDISGHVANCIRRGCPAYHSGEKKGGGHAWVCDGLWSLRSGSESMCLFHCNFGWGGTHNGWYRAGMFNTSKNMVSYTEWAGDSYSPDSSSAGLNYKTRQNCIVYNKP